MKKIILICLATSLLAGCAVTSILPSNSDGTMSKGQMELEWSSASNQCKNVYRQYKRSVEAADMNDIEKFTDINRKGQALAEQYNCNQDYLVALAMQNM